MKSESVCLAILSIMLLCLTTPLAAQDDVPIVAYNEVTTATLTEDNLQFFAQFEGQEGDVVYLLADYVEFSVADIEVDLRDSVGRTVGFREEYVFEPFVIGELASDGIYTVVITGEEEGEIEFVVGLSGYLEDGMEATIEAEGFQVIFLVRAEQTGTYTLSYERRSGSLGTELSIITFSEFFNENVIRVSGTSVDDWNATIHLNRGDMYVAFLDRNFFSGGGDEATVFIELTPE